LLPIGASPAEAGNSMKIPNIAVLILQGRLSIAPLVPPTLRHKKCFLPF